MLMYFLQLWFWMLLFFVLGALLALLVTHFMFKHVDDVRAEFASTTGGVRR